MDLKEFRFSKRFGQNFITDKNLLKSIVADAGITAQDMVLEIGAGAGTLTREIAASAKRVVAWEIDTTLEPYIAESLQGTDNTAVVFGDFLKAKEDKVYEALGRQEFKVVANLPYYITTPILFQLLNMPVPPVSISVMVQYEVAKRLAARENTADYGALTVAAAAFCTVTIARTVRKEMFVPRPNVDSAIVRLDRRTDNGIKSKSIYDRLVKSAFHMRRKTLVNNISGDFGITKPDAAELLVSAGLDEGIRGEAVSVEGFVKLANIIAEAYP